MHLLVGLGGGWGQNVTKHYLIYNGNKTSVQKRVRDDDSDTDSDNEMLMKSETNWPRFLIIESASEDLPLKKVISFCSSEGFSIYCRNPEEYQKTERWLLLGGVRQKGPGRKPTPNKAIY